MKRFHFFMGVALLTSIFFASSLKAQNQCPAQILYAAQNPCGAGFDGFYLYFQPTTGVPSEFTLQFASTSETPPCYYGTGTAVKQTGCGKTWWMAPSFACNKNPTGWFTFGSGKRCFYKNGLLETCDDFLVPCTDELLHFAKDFIAVPGANCKQWEGPCNTDSEIYRSGAVYIGTNNPAAGFAGYKLLVKGGIASEMLQLCQGEWCDYVFSDSFRLMPLPEVEQYIQANGHLPGCTPGPTIEQEGSFSLGEETVQQQEKIEENFLHLIALRKRLDALSARTEQRGIPKLPPALVSSPRQDEDSTMNTSSTVASPPVLSLECFQTRPATNDNTFDGEGGVIVTGVTGVLNISWTGPVGGQMSNVVCNGVIKLNGLKAGVYTVTVSSAGGLPVVCTLFIAQGAPVSCSKLMEDPCKTEIINTIKSDFSQTEPTCQQWDGDPCSTSAHLHRLGNVGIGTSAGRAGYSLAVKGGILTDRFFIQLCETGGWCDYVFDPGYPLPDLYDVERHIKAHQHLPGTVSQAEVTKQGGIELRAVKLDQQKKIEESYLYLIEMNKKVELLKRQLDSFNQ